MPAACRAAVESVPVAVHAVGSVPPTGQTFARSVVGEVPSVSSRSRSGSPGVAVNP